MQPLVKCSKPVQLSGMVKGKITRWLQSAGIKKSPDMVLVVGGLVASFWY